jgi:uncharacterized integral membrane protein
LAKLIAGAVILVALIVLVVLNVDNKSTISLYGAQLENVSVIVIALTGFFLGVLFSVVVYITNRLSRRKRASLEENGQPPATKSLTHADSEEAAPESSPERDSKRKQSSVRTKEKREAVES